ncbi:hypothetical protein IPM19_04485 [bacterium]|nr:MAG: hypothetical protein IPM19_04485 [bacterium]
MKLKFLLLLTILIGAVAFIGASKVNLFQSALAQSAPTPAPGNDVDSWGCEGLQNQIDEYSTGFGGDRLKELPKYCDEGAVYKKIVYWLYFVVGIGAVLAMIYGGYLYMTGRGNDAQIKKAKTVMMYTLGGVALAIIATAIVTIVVNLIVDNQLF